MFINWDAFTPGTALLGGALIGLASSLMILLLGRIAGISGIVGGLLVRATPDRTWRLTFVLGLVLAPLLWRQFFAPLPIVIAAEVPTLIVAGLLVGYGARLGAGCTSGHGVCGLSRLSVRSVTATLLFMAAGFATVFVTRHLLAI